MRSFMAKRIQSFGTSIFTEMSALALEHHAINLSQGFPDFAGPELIKQPAIDAIRDEKNQYAPASGLASLRQAAATTYARHYGLHADPLTEVTVTSGATEALFDSIMALVEPGDEVIVFQPAYDAYVPDIILAGGTPRFVTLRPPLPADPEAGSSGTRWTFDEEELRRAFTSKTRAILLNTPHNPTGKVFRRDELELIAQLCCEYDVVAIADEVYDQLVYDGQHLPLATLPNMWERTITINSTGKTFGVTGWKIGYALAPAPLTDAIRRVHQWVTFATATPFQDAAAVALTRAPEVGYYTDLLEFYRERRTLLVDILRDVGMIIAPPEGTYFVMADIKPWGIADDITFCRYLTTELGVAAIPPSAFYADPSQAPLMARFCFAKELATLHTAGERLRRRR